MWWQYLVCAGIGALTGAGELISRYRDSAEKALANGSAVVYVGVNAGAAATAFGLIQAMGWRFGAAEGSSALPWVQILVGGFGAMALFRSSLFMVRIGSSDIGIGPIGFLEVVLDAADRGVDRNRARARAYRVSEIMDGVKPDGDFDDAMFEDAAVALPMLCLALMQNASAQEQEILGEQVRRLTKAKASPDLRLLNLGLALMNFVGEHVLDAAVKAYRGKTKELKRQKGLQRRGRTNQRSAKRSPQPVEPGRGPTE
jgi:uncharacterized protein YejL (UPF0352 family)